MFLLPMESGEIVFVGLMDTSSRCVAAMDVKPVIEGDRFFRLEDQSLEPGP